MIDINKLKLSAKEQNILSILNTIINGGEVSSIDIGKETGLSVSTISRVINLLKNKDIIINIGKEQTDIGRHPEILRLNSDYGHIVFIDIYYAKIISYLTNLDGKILDTEEYFFEQGLNLDLFKEGLTDVYNKLLKNTEHSNINILAVGMSVPGVVNETNNTISRIPNIYSFNEINLSDYIENIISAPVVLCNESSLSAMGLAYEIYPERNILVYIAITEPTGIGAGIVINGKPHKGATNAAGEIGSMFVDIDNFDVEYDNVGSMESNAGVGKLIAELDDAISKGKATRLKALMDEQGAKKANIDLIEQAIQMLDYDVQEIYDRYIKIWAMSIINVIMIIDPDVIVLGGRVSPNNQLTLEKIRYFIKKGTYSEPDIRVSEIGSRATLIGGLNMTRGYIFNNILANIAIN